MRNAYYRRWSFPFLSDWSILLRLVVLLSKEDRFNQMCLLTSETVIELEWNKGNRQGNEQNFPPEQVSVMVCVVFMGRPHRTQHCSDAGATSCSSVLGSAQMRMLNTVCVSSTLPVMSWTFFFMQQFIFWNFVVLDFWVVTLQPGRWASVQGSWVRLSGEGGPLNPGLLSSLDEL